MVVTLFLVSGCVHIASKSTVPRSENPYDGCYLYKELLPATPRALTHAKLGRRDVQLINHWIVITPESQRKLLRWIRDPYNNELLVLVDTSRLYPSRALQALDSNLQLDPFSCDLIPVPST